MFCPLLALTTSQWALLSLALLFGLYMAWNIGANDVANAMGTSVGSKALTLKQAIILAAIFEFLGASLVGSHVSSTIRKGIFDPQRIVQQEVQEEFALAELPDAEAVTAIETEATDTISSIRLKAGADEKESIEDVMAKLNDSDAATMAQAQQTKDKIAKAKYEGAMTLAAGMIAALLAAGAWLQIASYFGWPVSTTHSIVGAVVGFGCIALGPSAVQWGGGNGIMIFSDGVAKIAASWVVSPLLSGTVAFLLFGLITRTVLRSDRPVEAARRQTPWMSAFVIAVLIGVLSFKGLKHTWKDLGKSDWWLGSDGVGGVAHWEIWTKLGMVTDDGVAITKLSSSHPFQWGSTVIFALLCGIIAFFVTRHLVRRINCAEDAGAHEQLDKVEKIFVYLQIVSACFVAFAHGANDVANAIGPLSAAVQSIREGAIHAKSSTPIWALVLGGVGIIVGLATWGWRVMETIGKRITELTPTRGFAAELATAVVILIASLPFKYTAVPISTTHTLVGAVLGVGLARGIGALNLRMVRDIVTSWVITIPAGAGLAILFYFILRIFF